MITNRVDDIASADSQPRSSEPAGKFVDALRALTPIDAAWTLAAATLFTYAHSAARLRSPPPWMDAIWIWQWLSVPFWLVFLVAFAFAERPSPRLHPRWLRYTIAVVLAVPVQYAGSLLLVGIVAGVGDLTSNAMTWMAIETLFAAAIAAIVYASLARERRARRAFARSALDRALANRRVVTTRLSVLRAKVEPQFLFDTLESIETLYARDASRADVLLDHLIDFLRDTLPVVRGEGTTLGQEVRLTESWLTLARVRLPGGFSYSVGVPESLAGVPFHAMLLLPLVENALRHGGRAIAANGHLDIRAERRGDRVVLSVGRSSATADSVDETEAITLLRETLRDLYAGDARLTFDTLASGSRMAVLDFPAEDAPGR